MDEFWYEENNDTAIEAEYRIIEDESSDEEPDTDLVDELCISPDIQSEINSEYPFLLEENMDSKLIETEPLHLNVSLDTEYTQNQPLSIQFTVEGKILNLDIFFSVIVLERTFQTYISDNIIEEFWDNHNCMIVFEDLLNNTVNSYLTKYIRVGLKQIYNLAFEENTKIHITLYLFYSLKDLTISLSLFTMLPYYNEDRKGLSQLRRIKGKIELSDTTYFKTTHFIFNIKDLCSLDTGSLNKMALSCGLDTKEKTSLDNYKTCMDLAIKEKPYEFLTYSLNDTLLLLKILDTKIEIYNTILKDVYKIEDSHVLFTRKTIPLTVGSTVNQIWMKYIHNILFQNNILFLVSSVKQSILNQLHSSYQVNKEILSYIEILRTQNH